MTSVLLLNPQGLSETGLFKTFSCEDFNRLNDIGIAHKIQLDDVVQNIAKDLKQNQLKDHVGVCRIHNHFKLYPGEVIQLTLGTSIDDPTLTVDKNASVVHLKPTATIETITAPIPYMFAYDKTTKQFFPIQYFDGTNETMKERLLDLCETKRNELVVFLNRFVNHVETTGTEDDLGFYILYEDLIDSKKGNGDGLLEETDVVERKQHMVPTTKQMLDEIVQEKRKIDPTYKMTMTHWFFNGHDDDLGFSGCCSCCGHHCLH